jgi:hypothetical protein
MVTCSNCGAGIPDDSAFCGQCGAPRPDEVKTEHEPVPVDIDVEAEQAAQMGEPKVPPTPESVPIPDYPSPAPVQETRRGGNTCLWFVLGCLFLILVLLCILIIVFAFSLSTATDILNQVF